LCGNVQPNFAELFRRHPDWRAYERKTGIAWLAFAVLLSLYCISKSLITEVCGAGKTRSTQPSPRIGSGFEQIEQTEFL
jgi:hypothetical protein